MLRLILPVAGILLLSPGIAASGVSFVDAFDVPAGAGYVGSETCLDCHDDVGEFYANSPHSPDRGLAIPGTGIAGCEACHGPGSLHVEEDGDGFIIGPEILASQSQGVKVAMCTQCHTDKGLEWTGGPHAGTNISCANCHTDQVHFAGGVTPVTEYRNKGEFCLQCHTAQVTDFRLPFRHRVLEGQIDCQDCHNPHAAFDQTDWNGLNGVCLECHVEMEGPFVYEHEGVASEDCVTCHRPHGSNHDKLLITESNSMCLQCHFEQGFNAGNNWTMGGMPHGGLLTGEARCYDCHTEVHGSNTDPNFKDQ